MEQRSIEHVTTIALRFVGVLTVFIGLILITYTIFALIGAHSTTSDLFRNMPEGMDINMRGMFSWVAVGEVAIIVWGGLFIRLAKPIARGIARE